MIVHNEGGHKVNAIDKTLLRHEFMRMAAFKPCQDYYGGGNFKTLSDDVFSFFFLQFKSNFVLKKINLSSDIRSSLYPMSPS